MTTLIAVGVAIMVAAYQRIQSDGTQWYWLALSGIGGAFIGAGYGAPFKTKAWGACTGFLMGFAPIPAWLSKLLR